MHVWKFAYQYGAEVREITLLLVRNDKKGQPVGYELWPFSADLASGDPIRRWIVDDEPTTIIHQIVAHEDLGRIREVTL